MDRERGLAPVREPDRNSPVNRAAKTRKRPKNLATQARRSNCGRAGHHAASATFTSTCRPAAATMFTSVSRLKRARPFPTVAPFYRLPACRECASPVSQPGKMREPLPQLRRLQFRWLALPSHSVTEAMGRFSQSVIVRKERTMEMVFVTVSLLETWRSASAGNVIVSSTWSAQIPLAEMLCLFVLIFECRGRRTKRE